MVWWVVRISGGWMDFLEDLWILVLLPPLSTAIHCNPATLAGTQKTLYKQMVKGPEDGS